MNQLAVVSGKELSPMSEMDMQNQVNTIQKVMKQVMKKDVHYGVIPGTKTPSLYKPGAEKIMATFRLSADPQITDLSDGDQIRYQVKVNLVSPSGVFVGSGIGECSSNEEKYKWRRAICDEEFEEAPEARKREKWSKGWQNKPNYKQKQIRTEPADLANTILKMAKKRALIDGVLTATAASDCFTQDIEDLPEEYINQEAPAQGRHAPTNELTLSKNQIDDLNAAMKAAGVSAQRMCSKAGVQSIENILQRDMNRCKDWLQKVAQNGSN